MTRRSVNWVAKSSAFAALHNPVLFPSPVTFQVFPLHSSLLAFLGGIYFPSLLKEDPSDLVSDQTTEGAGDSIKNKETTDLIGYYDSNYCDCFSIHPNMFYHCEII